jgi:antitoxin ParD1/3/4
MAIEVRPEIQALIEKDIQRGPYRSANDYVEQAVRLLHAQEEWFAENRDEIAAKVQAGWDEAERGDLVDVEDVRRAMQQFKRAWLDRRRPG